NQSTPRVLGWGTGNDPYFSTANNTIQLPMRSLAAAAATAPEGVPGGGVRLDAVAGPQIVGRVPLAAAVDSTGRVLALYSKDASVDTGFALTGGMYGAIPNVPFKINAQNTEGFFSVGLDPTRFAKAGDKQFGVIHSNLLTKQEGLFFPWRTDATAGPATNQSIYDGSPPHGMRAIADKDNLVARPFDTADGMTVTPQLSFNALFNGGVSGNVGVLQPFQPNYGVGTILGVGNSATDTPVTAASIKLQNTAVAVMRGGVMFDDLKGKTAVVDIGTHQQLVLPDQTLVTGVWRFMDASGKLGLEAGTGWRNVSLNKLAYNQQTSQFQMGDQVASIATVGDTVVARGTFTGVAPNPAWSPGGLILQDGWNRSDPISQSRLMITGVQQSYGMDVPSKVQFRVDNSLQGISSVPLQLSATMDLSANSFGMRSLFGEGSRYWSMPVSMGGPRIPTNQYGSMKDLISGLSGQQVTGGMLNLNPKQAGLAPMTPYPTEFHAWAPDRPMEMTAILRSGAGLEPILTKFSDSYFVIQSQPSQDWNFARWTTPNGGGLTSIGYSMTRLMDGTQLKGQADVFKTGPTSYYLSTNGQIFHLPQFIVPDGAGADPIHVPPSIYQVQQGFADSYVSTIQGVNGSNVNIGLRINDPASLMFAGPTAAMQLDYTALNTNSTVSFSDKYMQSVGNRPTFTLAVTSSPTGRLWQAGIHITESGNLARSGIAMRDGALVTPGAAGFVGTADAPVPQLIIGTKIFNPYEPTRPIQGPATLKDAWYTFRVQPNGSTKVIDGQAAAIRIAGRETALSTRQLNDILYTNPHTAFPLLMAQTDLGSGGAPMSSGRLTTVAQMSSNPGLFTGSQKFLFTASPNVIAPSGQVTGIVTNVNWRLENRGLVSTTAVLDPSTGNTVTTKGIYLGNLPPSSTIHIDQGGTVRTPGSGVFAGTIHAVIPKAEYTAGVYDQTVPGAARETLVTLHNFYYAGIVDNEGLVRIQSGNVGQVTMGGQPVELANHDLVGGVRTTGTAQLVLPFGGGTNQSANNQPMPVGAPGFTPGRNVEQIDGTNFFQGRQMWNVTPVANVIGERGLVSGNWANLTIMPTDPQTAIPAFVTFGRDSHLVSGGVYVMPTEAQLLSGRGSGQTTVMPNSGVIQFNAAGDLHHGIRALSAPIQTSNGTPANAIQFVTVEKSQPMFNKSFFVLTEPAVIDGIPYEANTILSMTPQGAPDVGMSPTSIPVQITVTDPDGSNPRIETRLIQPVGMFAVISDEQQHVLGTIPILRGQLPAGPAITVQHIIQKEISVYNPDAKPEEQPLPDIDMYDPSQVGLFRTIFQQGETFWPQHRNKLADALNRPPNDDLINTTINNMQRDYQYALNSFLSPPNLESAQNAPPNTLETMLGKGRLPVFVIPNGMSFEQAMASNQAMAAYINDTALVPIIDAQLVMGRDLKGTAYQMAQNYHDGKLVTSIRNGTLNLMTTVGGVVFAGMAAFNLVHGIAQVGVRQAAAQGGRTALTWGGVWVGGEAAYYGAQWLEDRGAGENPYGRIGIEALNTINIGTRSALWARTYGWSVPFAPVKLSDNSWFQNTKIDVPYLGEVRVGDLIAGTVAVASFARGGRLTNMERMERGLSEMATAQLEPMYGKIAADGALQSFRNNMTKGGFAAAGKNILTMPISAAATSQISAWANDYILPGTTGLQHSIVSASAGSFDERPTNALGQRIGSNYVFGQQVFLTYTEKERLIPLVVFGGLLHFTEPFAGAALKRVPVFNTHFERLGTVSQRMGNWAETVVPANGLSRSMLVGTFEEVLPEQLVQTGAAPGLWWMADRFPYIKDLPYEEKKSYVLAAGEILGESAVGGGDAYSILKEPPAVSVPKQPVVNPFQMPQFLTQDFASLSGMSTSGMSTAPSADIRPGFGDLSAFLDPGQLFNTGKVTYPIVPVNTAGALAVQQPSPASIPVNVQADIDLGAIRSLGVVSAASGMFNGKPGSSEPAVIGPALPSPSSPPGLKIGQALDGRRFSEGPAGGRVSPTIVIIGPDGLPAQTGRPVTLSRLQSADHLAEQAAAKLPSVPHTRQTPEMLDAAAAPAIQIFGSNGERVTTSSTRAYSPAPARLAIPADVREGAIGGPMPTQPSAPTRLAIPADV
ncbi:MAG: hypothetical protein HYU33_05260, partial [Candidatus Omnitrophica bacterium]|nr:hypothetical protein [Candidatus Omnitrophota bacterium]